MNEPIIIVPKIYVVTYEHRHGLDVSAFRTEEAAYTAAREIALERVHEQWEAYEDATFRGMDSDVEALSYFSEVECNFLEPESIEVRETLLQCDAKYLGAIPTR